MANTTKPMATTMGKRIAMTKPKHELFTILTTFSTSTTSHYAKFI